MSVDVQPDSRCRRFSKPFFLEGQWWVKVYCHNCGVLGARVPERTTTFASYLCKACAAQYGEIQGTLMLPDEVFYAALKEVTFDARGRLRNAPTLAAMFANPSPGLAALVRDRQRALRRLRGG